jgi:hypothetical protein
MGCTHPPKIPAGIGSKSAGSRRTEPAPPRTAPESLPGGGGSVRRSGCSPGNRGFSRAACKQARSAVAQWRDSPISEDFSGPSRGTSCAEGPAPPTVVASRKRKKSRHTIYRGCVRLRGPEAVVARRLAHHVHPPVWTDHGPQSTTPPPKACRPTPSASRGPLGACRSSTESSRMSADRRYPTGPSAAVLGEAPGWSPGFSRSVPP